MCKNKTYNVAMKQKRENGGAWLMDNSNSLVNKKKNKLWTTIWKHRYLYLMLLPGLILAIWAQARVSSTYGKYKKVLSSKGKTGAEVAKICTR